MVRKSINDKECWFCGNQRGLEQHEIFFGTYKRKMSIKYGLVVWLCYHCHRGNKGVHHNRENDLILKRFGQKVFEEKNPQEEFIKVFGRNYDKWNQIQNRTR